MIGIDITLLIHLLRNEFSAKKKSLELDKESFLFTTEANVYEIVSGIKKSKVESARAVADFETLLARFTVLPLDRKAAIMAGRIAAGLLEKGKMIDDIDCLIAGIFLSNGCNRIVTRNKKHFERIEGMSVETY